VALRHSQEVARADAHYGLVVQRSAHRLWLEQAQRRWKEKEERLAVMEQRAAVVGRRRVLRFWLVQWKLHHAGRLTEKRASAPPPAPHPIALVCDGASLTSFFPFLCVWAVQ
jgi:hypothetical protein